MPDKELDEMLPMVFASKDANLIERQFNPQPPTALNLHLWHDAAQRALIYWSRLCESAALSPDFRQIAASNRLTLAELASQRQ